MEKHQRGLCAASIAMNFKLSDRVGGPSTMPIVSCHLEPPSIIPSLLSLGPGEWAAGSRYGLSAFKSKGNLHDFSSTSFCLVPWLVMVAPSLWLHPRYGCTLTPTSLPCSLNLRQQLHAQEAIHTTSCPVLVHASWLSGFPRPVWPLFARDATFCCMAPSSLSARLGSAAAYPAVGEIATGKA